MSVTPLAPNGEPGLLARHLARYAGNRTLLLYVGAVVLAGLGALAAGSWPLSRLVSVSFVAWLVISIFAEFLWLETLSGDCTDSMASTVNFSVIFLVGGGIAVWVIALSVLLATRYIQKRDWVRSLFGLGQMAITALVTAGLFRLLHPAPMELGSLSEPRTVLAMLAAAAVYFFVNTGLVAAAVSLERRHPFWQTWRENYAYRNSIVSSVALFALSPLLVLSYLTLGYPGVALFFVPLLIIRNQNREYINLQKMTQALISTERMAAKGEMAAEVAHEINNYLAVLSGRTQLLLMRAARAGDDAMKQDADIIRAQIGRMSALAKGLLDFSHKEIHVQEFDANKLVADTVEFLRPQNLFDRVALECELDGELAAVTADPGQIQQVLLNLVKNAAEAMRDAAAGRGTPQGETEGAAEAVGPHGSIRVRTSRPSRGMVRISVVDDGPGMPREVSSKVFEPGFTTKHDGHGYGLATCYRILQNHGGRIWVESEPGQGTSFHLEWPARATVGGESRAAADAAATGEPGREAGAA